MSLTVDEALRFADQQYTKQSFAGVLTAEVRRLSAEIERLTARIDAVTDTARQRWPEVVTMEDGWQAMARSRDDAEAELAKLREQKPVAWMHDKDGRVDTCHDSVKELWIKVGQKQNTQFMREIVPCMVEHYNIPLYAAPVPAPAVPAPVQTAKQADCRTCANSGKVNGLSQETYCESCVHEGRNWRKNHFLDAAGQRLLEGGG